MEAVEREREAVAEVIRVMRMQQAWLNDRLEGGSDDEFYYVLMWQVATLYLLCDYGEAILTIGQSGLRAIRALNRTVLEAAIRLNYYVTIPSEAVKHGQSIQPATIGMMRAAKDQRGDFSVDEFIEFKNFVTQQVSRPTFGAFKPMLETTLKAFRVLPSKFEQVTDGFYMEYNIGSGFIHGSFSCILDVFQKSDDRYGCVNVSETSYYLTLKSELKRYVGATFLALVALERFHKCERGISLHFRTATLMCGYVAGEKASFFTHDSSWSLVSEYYKSRIV